MRESQLRRQCILTTSRQRLLQRHVYYRTVRPDTGFTRVLVSQRETKVDLYLYFLSMVPLPGNDSDTLGCSGDWNTQR
jgi:hypothetical protein